MFELTKRDMIEIYTSLIIITLTSVTKSYILKQNIIIHEIIITTIFIIISKFLCIRVMHQVDKHLDDKKQKSKK
jgi:hypothetical protein